jgi:hypothetical protein
MQVAHTTADFEYVSVLITGLIQAFHQLLLRWLESFAFKALTVPSGKTRKKTIRRIGMWTTTAHSGVPRSGIVSCYQKLTAIPDLTGRFHGLFRVGLDRRGKLRIVPGMKQS